MKPKNYYVLTMWTILIGSFIAANHIDVKRYNPYQILTWEIKANEGYRQWWYPDGHFIYKGKRRKSHSIGFGWNDLGGLRRSEILRYTEDGVVTLDEAWKISMMEIEKWPRFHTDPYKNVAMQLYSYNCGRIKSPKQLGKCHRGINVKNKRCGHANSDVRKVHNVRREFELALYNHDWINIQIRTEQNQKKVNAINQRVKNKRNKPR